MRKNLLILATFLLGIGVGLVYATTFSYTYDTATPAGSDDPAEADDRMREIKAAVQERENVDHYWPLTGTEVSNPDAGKHRWLHLLDANGLATIDDNEYGLFIKDVCGIKELHGIDEDENELQITSAGALLLTGARIPNDTFIKAIDNAGTGTVNLIKADVNDVAVLPENTQLVPGVTPDANDEIVNKKYVDDNVGSANYTPTAESGAAGSNGVTIFPNGFRIQRGTESVAAGAEDTITLSGWTAVYKATATINEDGATDRTSPKISGYSGNTFNIRNTASVTLSYDWIAIGY